MQNPLTPPAADHVADGLRERKKRARRGELIDAAQALVTEQGLDAVTVESICARAGVSVRTFFNYFESKDDAVLGVQPSVLDAAAAAVFAAGGPTGRLGTDLERLVTSLVHEPSGGRNRIACAMELARREPRLLGRQVAAFERHHAELAGIVATRLGTDVTAPRVELLTMLAMSLTRASFVHWEASGQAGELRDAVPLVIAELRDLLRDD